MDRKELETLIRTLVEQYLARGPLHADPVPRGQPCLKVVTEVEVREAGLEGIVPAAADAIVTAAADDLARAWGVRIQRGGPALKRPRCVDVGADHAGYETKEDTKRFLDLCRTEDLRQLVQCGAERFGVESLAASVSGDLAQYIDHTLLKPDASEAQIRQLCKEAAQYRFATVCVNPTWVRLCTRVLKGTGVGICTVAGFPLGATPGDVKAYEARRAVFDGANEVDMVINVGLLKSGRDDLVLDDICHVARTVHDGCARVKVIIEAALLTNEEKVRACTLAKQAGADYVKTSTGFGPGGATAEDVALMRRVVGTEIGVKAAGGIRDLAAAQKMIAAGATRVGASAGVKIVQEALKSGGK